MKNIKRENLEDVEEKFKREFEKKHRKKPMKVSGAGVRNIPRIQEKRFSKNR